MRRRAKSAFAGKQKKYLSWQALGIALLMYALFLTGFSWGVSATPKLASAFVLPTQEPRSIPEEQEIISSDESILILPQQEPQQEAKQETKQQEHKQAVIYCTHTSEQYAGETRKNGQAGGVFQAAAALAAELENLGIGVILLEDVFDAPDWNNAYANSLAAIEQVKKENPEIELFIDVHRDSAIEGLNTHLASGGISYARMLLIIGSDVNLPHAKWQQNLSFAETLHEQLDEMLPGIMRDYKIYNGRYNQHVGTQSILVEIGSETNSTAEAKASAKLLAEALNEIL